VHLGEFAKEVKIGIYQEGARPANFHGTDICDGWAMLHGLLRRYSKYAVSAMKGAFLEG